ncbi:MAG: class I SAM-dependent methyltransferase [Candidatus Kapabacteria bacterium]|jgi:ubiquinone/menaquinone biosynthesis C-methylase UbiE|nr:class I SAM-dependent methyltransferase [Candidatus Kapabacteria bacterium]
MNWKYKAFLQKSFDMIPFGRNLNYFMQRNITKNLPVDDNTFFQKFKFSFAQHKKIGQISSLDMKNIKSLEFGAGWDLLTPLSYYMLAVKEQIVIDLFHNMKTDLINNSIQRFVENKSELEKKHSLLLRDIPDKTISGYEDLNDNFGIKYMAPVNAAKTGFEDNSFDYITSLSTLEHVPESEINGILNECYRILKPGGVLSCIVDLRDHYSYFDQSISIYNFLKYSDKQWKLYNHDLQYQNRLRNSDYKDIVNSTKFRIAEYNISECDSVEKEQLENLALNDKYINNSIDDMGIKEIWMLLVKDK